MKRQIEKKDSEIAEAKSDEKMSHSCIAAETFKGSPKCFFYFWNHWYHWYCVFIAWLLAIVSHVLTCFAAPAMFVPYEDHEATLAASNLMLFRV